jgi:hypothetical protein
MDDEWKYVYSAADDREYLMRRGPGEGPTCDRNECADYAADSAAQPALERATSGAGGALVERFQRDGYLEPLDGADPGGLRRYPAPALPWEPLDELEDRSVVGRGWQYARWNRSASVAEGPAAAYDLRRDSTKTAYRFPSRDVRGSNTVEGAARAR